MFAIYFATICNYVSSDGLPCGEYLFDHRNATLRQWLTDVYIMGSTNGTGVNNSAIGGLYIDDGWTDTQDPILPWEPPNGYCDHNIYGGPTEVDYKCIQDMNLSATDVENITFGWKQSMQSAQSAMVAVGAYNWQLFHSVNGSPNLSECTNWMRNDGMKLVNHSLQFSYTQINQYF